MDEQAYLEPGFDPATLTIPKLRSILLAHNVNYPSSAKKGQLVDIFNEHVVPQARKLRAANARVKRTSRGIEDVPSQNSAYDYDEVPEPPTTRSSRRTTRARTEEAEEVVPVRAVRHGTAPPEYTPRRSVTDAEEIEAVPRRSSSKKSRLSANTPVAKREIPEDDESPFTHDNVFQSGSSPPTGVDNDRRRTTSSVVRDTDRSRSKENRRRTGDVKPPRHVLESVTIPARRKVERPVSILKEPKHEIDVSEEFTPEESQELVRAQQSGELVPARRRTKQSTPQAVRVFPVAVTALFLAISGAVWREEKFNVGYCGVGQPSTEIAGIPASKIPDWVKPQCEPCPPHAFCNEKLETTCDADFVLTPHPFSLNGLIPLPPTCEPDSAKARKVNAVKERAIEELREQNAKYECNEAPSAEIKETELKKAISTKRRKGMTNEEFEELWKSALGEIQRADEVVSGTDGSSGVFTLRSTSLARLPLSCAGRRYVRETLREYVWQLVMMALVLTSSSYGYHRVTSGRETEKRAKELAKVALNKLAQQASLHAYDPDAYRENYMSVAQLRDDVLRDEFSASRRTKLWERVQRKVEGNSNVRPMVREGRSGDVGRMWEWVGAVGMIESPPAEGREGHRRRRSGRVSFGGAEERLIEAREDSEMSQVNNRWQEGGSYY